MKKLITLILILFIGAVLVNCAALFTKSVDPSAKAEIIDYQGSITVDRKQVEAEAFELAVGANLIQNDQLSVAHGSSVTLQLMRGITLTLQNQGGAMMNSLIGEDSEEVSISLSTPGLVATLNAQEVVPEDFSLALNVLKLFVSPAEAGTIAKLVIMDANAVRVIVEEGAANVTSCEDDDCIPAVRVSAGSMVEIPSVLEAVIPEPVSLDTLAGGAEITSLSGTGAAVILRNGSEATPEAGGSVRMGDVLRTGGEEVSISLAEGVSITLSGDGEFGMDSLIGAEADMIMISILSGSGMVSLSIGEDFESDCILTCNGMEIYPEPGTEIEVEITGPGQGKVTAIAGLVYLDYVYTYSTETGDEFPGTASGEAEEGGSVEYDLPDVEDGYVFPGNERPNEDEIFIYP